MKRLVKILCISLLALGLVGCQESDINSERGTEYTYDFVDLMDVKLYGSDGLGFIEVRPKEISVSDPMFKSEADFIAVKKAMSQLNLYVGPDKNHKSNLTISPNTLLKNGDVVTFSLTNVNPANIKDVSINLEPYNWKISDAEGNGLLSKPEVIDFFSNDVVMFYGLEGTNKAYPYKIDNQLIPEDIFKNLEYEIEVDDKQLKAEQSVITVKAKLNEDFLKSGDNPAFNTATYLGRQGLFAQDKQEKVLNTVVKPIDITKLNEKEEIAITAAIKEYLDTQLIRVNSKDYKTEMVATVQQYSNANGSYNPYDFYVTFKASYGSERVCLMTNLKIVKLNDEYVIPERMGGFTTTGEAYCSSPMSGMDLIINNNVMYIPEEQPAEETYELVNVENQPAESQEQSNETTQSSEDNTEENIDTQSVEIIENGGSN